MRIKFVFIMLGVFTGMVFAETGINKTAADYICRKAVESRKKTLAFFPVVTKEGETYDYTNASTDAIMKVIAERGGMTVISPEQIDAILNKQPMGMSYLEAASDQGKLLKADLLVYCIQEPSKLQVRIADTETDAIIGATVRENDSGAGSLKDDDMNYRMNENEFGLNRVQRSLNRLYVKRPFTYLYVTATKEELAEMEKRFPSQMSKLKSYYENIPS